MSSGPPIVTLLEPADPRWEAALEGMPHDVYQLPGYVALAAGMQPNGRPLAVLVERGPDRLLLPLIIQPIPGAMDGGDASRDAVSPRGYAGPIVRTTDDSGPFLDEALTAAFGALRDLGVVTAFVRLHPLLELPPPVLSRHGSLVEHGDSVSIDLGRSEDELWRQMRSNHRRDITAAKRAGLVARIDEDWSHFDEFVAAFAESMERLDAEPWWRLGGDYFAALRQGVGDHLSLCVVEDEGRVAAAALLTEVDGIVEYHLSGTFDAYIPASPSKLIIHFATLWAKGRGNRVLHLAGSLRKGDALIRFKLGFSPVAHPVRSWRVILQPDAYHSLVAARRSADPTADPDVDADQAYFPAYRRPESLRSVADGEGDAS
jgi:hypothetical protein